MILITLAFLAGDSSRQELLSSMSYSKTSLFDTATIQKFSCSTAKLNSTQSSIFIVVNYSFRMEMKLN